MDHLPRPHYVELLEQEQKPVVPASIWPAFTGLASVMAPLFPAPANALEDIALEINDLQVLFSDSVNNLNNIIVEGLDVNEKIASSIVMALNEQGVPTNAEMYAAFQEGLHNLYNSLPEILARLDGLSEQEKIAATIATIVISYPLSYQYYKFENAQEKRKAAEKKAAIAKKKKLATEAKKQKNALLKKKEKSKGEKATKQPIVTKPKSMQDEVVVATAATQIEEEAIVVSVEIPASQDVVVNDVPEVIGNTEQPLVPQQRQDVTSGVDAYAQAYAAMLQQTSPAEMMAQSPRNVEMVEQQEQQPEAVAASGYTSGNKRRTTPLSTTATYLESLTP